MSYFLVVYDRSTGELRELTEFGEDQADHAAQARLDRELAERTHPEVEVVVVASPSRAALERTHARYFKTVSELTATGL
jgi:broad specificity phosphatase PhoE